MKVGIIRDDRFLEHKTGHIHPEHPNRLKAIYRMLDKEADMGLVDMEAETATMEQLELVHTPNHIKKILKTADQAFINLAPDTPASAKTYLAAWLAVGGCIRGLEAMLSGACDVCFALVRPPGHHALPNQVSGFCIFNNLAVTARFAAERYGFNRILIVDWDVHHGHGLNDFFYKDPGVFYLSTHDTLLYPHSGDFSNVGEEKGAGYTLNIPIPRDLEDDDMISLYQRLLTPVMRRFAPQLVLVAAGFDGHKDDPIGRSRLTENAYGDLARILLSLRAEVRGPRPLLLLALEGGYDPPSLARCVREVLRALLEGSSSIGDKGLTSRAARLLDQAGEVHRRYGVWVE